MRRSTQSPRSVSPSRTSPSGSRRAPPAAAVRRSCEEPCRNACAATVASTRGASPGRRTPSRAHSSPWAQKGLCSSRATSAHAAGPLSRSRPSCLHPPPRARSELRSRRTKTRAEAQGVSASRTQALKSKASASRDHSPQHASRTASLRGSPSSSGLVQGAVWGWTPRKASHRFRAAAAARASSPPASLRPSLRARRAQTSLSRASSGTWPRAPSGTSSCAASASSSCTGCSTPSAAVRVSQASSLRSSSWASPSCAGLDRARAE
mmetsp:Transcript_90753/g.236389  ORF Transcript_90753/g.236389 Transcript_90753/m.236389 type:complete len:265 (+) Transcript_90753:323-1117(+)